MLSINSLIPNYEQRAKNYHFNKEKQINKRSELIGSLDNGKNEYIWRVERYFITESIAECYKDKTVLEK